MNPLDFSMPASLATLSDLQRLISEIERVDSRLGDMKIHQQIGHPVGNDLIFSKQLVEFLELNNIDINDAGIRGQLLIGVRQLKNTVPVVHVTFAAAAEHEELAKFVDWVRQSVHPQAVLTVGLQPDLIGGAYVRTTNKVFDMSIRTQLASGRQIIKQDLEALSGAV